MPHDKNGNALQPGDHVTVKARVLGVNECDEYCNASLETEEPMYPADFKTSLTLNARQVEKV